jgi:hypothetical protein
MKKQAHIKTYYILFEQPKQAIRRPPKRRTKQLMRMPGSLKTRTQRVPFKPRCEVFDKCEINMEKGREEDSELRRRRPLSSSSSSSLSSHTPQTPLFKSHAQPTHASSHSANHADHVGSGGDPEDADKVSPDPAPVSSTTPPADQTSSPLPPDERLCRICFGGPEEDDATLGRLISPCKCKGSMKFVHIGKFRLLILWCFETSDVDRLSERVEACDPKERVLL